jgi:hypothetical protein
MVAARQGCAQSEDLPGPRYAKNNLFSGFGANREPDSPLADHKGCQGRLAFGEQELAASDAADRLDSVERLQGVGGKVAEEPFRPMLTLQTALRNRALHMPCFKPVATPLQ